MRVFTVAAVAALRVGQKVVEIVAFIAMLISIAFMFLAIKLSPDMHNAVQGALDNVEAEGIKKGYHRASGKTIK